jgi:hypothetical protein
MSFSEKNSIPQKIRINDARNLGIPGYKFDYLRGRIGFWEFIFEFPRIIKLLIKRIRHTMKYEREYIRENEQKNTST